MNTRTRTYHMIRMIHYIFIDSIMRIIYKGDAMIIREKEILKVNSMSYLLMYFKPLI